MPALLNVLAFVGLALLLGGALTRRWLTPGTPPLWMLGGGLALLLLAWAGQVAVTLQALNLGAADSLPYLTDTAAGRAMLTGLMGAALLLAAETGRWPIAFTWGAAGVTLWGVAGVGHGAGHGPGVRALHAAHAGAMVVWVGGVLALRLTRPAALALARRFMPAALLSVTTLAVTGLLMAGEHLHTLAQWTGSAYGQALLVKLTLVTATLLAAVGVRRAFARGGGVRAALLREGTLLLGVLAVTAALVVQSPPPWP